MKKALCPQCGFELKMKDRVCPRCGGQIEKAFERGGSRLAGFFENRAKSERRLAWGYVYRSEAEILGWPVIHVAFGKDAETGKIIVAKGIIAIGQFGVGLITIAQIGVGLIFGFGQCVAGIVAVGQFALGIYFGLGQFATGLTAIGQFALGRYILSQMGLGEYVWSTKRRDPEAVEHFSNLWQNVKELMN